MAAMDRTRILWIVIGVVIGVVVFALLSNLTGYRDWMVPLGAGVGAALGIAYDQRKRNKA
ncbi:MAG: hypothetical protein AB7F76_04740 [Parvibaculaceae bacterium]